MTTESTLREALASESDHYTVRRRVRVGERNTVFEATVDGRRAACKLTDCQPATLAHEGAVQRAIAERTDRRVPAVLADGDGYLLLEWVDGETCADRDPGERRRDRLRSVGRWLARLHGATEGWFDGHGTLERSGRPLAVAEPAAWATRLGEFVERWAGELAGTASADTGTAVASAVDAHRESLANCRPVLVHGEASGDHVLFDGGEVATLLDWELAQAAPGGFDLVWAERDLLGRSVSAGRHGSLRRALYDGYASERHLGPGFPVRRELYRAAFAMRELTLVHDPEMPAQSGREDYGAALRGFVSGRLAAADSLSGRVA
ncbi:phosphotransferase family protein [Halosimplex marinum]|uniref:phosphotransferase family protein n=1 Tax=Halosimplex marinum TaxID=3396620 RepID=UPI003F576E70